MIGLLIKHWDIYIIKDRRMYFIDSSNIFDLSIASEKMVFVDGNIFKYKYGFGNFFNPSYLCMYALMNLNKYYKNWDQEAKDVFLEVADWLVKNAKKHKGSLVWFYNFNWREGKTFLRKPWISAMSQGLAISVLSRAYRLTGDKKFLKIAYKAASVFHLDVKDGGVMTIENGGVFYEEYPAKPYQKILDGFIFSLLGIYDLYSVQKNKDVKDIFDEGVKTLEKNLSRWDYFGTWSRYGSLLSSKDYNNLNCVLLKVLYRLTKKKVFYNYSNKWSRENLVKFLFVCPSYVLKFFKNYLE